MDIKKNDPQTIAVIGAGLAGTMTAALLVNLGFKVTIFEKRPLEKEDDRSKTSSAFGNSTNALKRSINLALSTRGMQALEKLGFLEEVMKSAIRMPQRVIHSIDGTESTQPYGNPDQALYSVGRGELNHMLQDFLHKHGEVETFFGYTLVQVDRTGHCIFRTPLGNEYTAHYDLVIGADGAYSGVRECLLKQGRISYSRQYVRHGYKELTIPARASFNSPELRYALKNYEGLHIWPRGDFMLIALPNPDKSFTATLFAPYNGPGGFDTINSQNDNEIISYFQTYFPDALSLMPNIEEDYRLNPVGSLVTVKVDPWNTGKVVLIGDAAHAVVPFYGQGMNAAFQDAYMLAEIIEKKLEFVSLGRIDLIECTKQFAEMRKPATDALAELCLEHYHDMASSTASPLYLIRKKVESWLGYWMPETFQSLYSMVAFTTIPYHKAVERAKKQENWVRNACWLSAVGLGVGALVVRHKLKHSHN